jgi:predicted component of type VI protein secretion system
MHQLVITSGKHQGQHLLLPADRDVTIGREDGCQIVLHSALISRRHCVLRRVADGVWVTDLESQNGTFVNEVPITEPTMMVHGDTLRVGAIVFEVVSVTDETGSAPPAPAAEKEPRPSKPAGTAPTSSAGTPKKPPSGKVSDADIASWLTDETGGKKPQGDDTAIIRGRSQVTPLPPNRSAPAASPPSTVSGTAPAGPTTGAGLGAASRATDGSGTNAPGVMRKPKTVKEEAADIIRRHWAKVKGTPPEAPSSEPPANGP